MQEAAAFCTTSDPAATAATNFDTAKAFHEVLVARDVWGEYVESFSTDLSNAAVAAASAAAMKEGGGKDKKGAAGGAKNNKKKKQRKATGSKIMGADRHGGGTPIDESIFLYGNCSRVSCSET